MIPIKFKEANRLLNKPAEMTDKECSPMHVLADGKCCISKWQATPEERERFLITGELWVSVWSGESQPPIWIGPYKPFDTIIEGAK